MEIIDAHTHVFPKITGCFGGMPILSDGYGRAHAGRERLQLMPPSFSDNTSPPELLIAHMDESGVDRAVLMANPLYGFHNGYLRRCTGRYPDRLRGVALVDVLLGLEAADELEGIYREGILFGMKFETARSFQFAPETRLSDKLLEPVWECCEAYGQPVFLHLFRACDLSDTVLLSRRYPHIKFVLCHLGADACFGGDAGEDRFEWLLETARRMENIYLDTSSVPDYFPEGFPFPASALRIVRAWRALGAGRLLWGSDYPGMLKFATYGQLIDLVRCGCREIPEGDLERIMGENARGLFFKDGR